MEEVAKLKAKEERRKLESEVRSAHLLFQSINYIPLKILVVQQYPCLFAFYLLKLTPD